MIGTGQMPASSSTLNSSTSAAIRHHSASNGDLKDQTELKYEGKIIGIFEEFDDGFLVR